MAEVSCATSLDERFDPANVLTSNPKEFWISTGLYPQEITFTFLSARVVNNVQVTCNGAKRISIDACQTNAGNQFKTIA